MSNVFPVLVPKNMDEEVMIARGSAILAISEVDGLPGNFKMYYEGNLNGASNLTEFDDKCYHAAARGVTKYPTVAFKVDNIANYDVVGHYNYDEKKLHITDQLTLEDWEDEHGFNNTMQP